MILPFLGEYQTYFIGCVDNIKNFTSAPNYPSDEIFLAFTIKKDRFSFFILSFKKKQRKKGSFRFKPTFFSLILLGATLLVIIILGVK